MMRSKFQREMQELNEELKRMSRFIEDTLGNAMEALRSGSQSLARQVYENDHIADELELSIERKSLLILLSEQPVAKDLRVISTALKMITDMERICDQGADIAEIVLHLGEEPNARPAQLYTMADKCVIMVNEAIHAFLTDDTMLAEAVIQSDDEIDRLFMQVRGELVKDILKDPSSSSRKMDELMIAKYLERIGDHAQNIAEWVIFAVTGEHKNRQIL